MKPEEIEAIKTRYNNFETRHQDIPALLSALEAAQEENRRLREAETSLTFDRFRAANVTRCVKWHPRGIGSWSPSDWLVAVTGEIGELASLLKMRNRERDGLPGNKFSPTDKQIADELADVLTYLDLLAAVLGVDLGLAAVQKFNEVSERVGFPDRIDIAQALARPEKEGVYFRAECIFRYCPTALKCADAKQCFSPTKEKEGG